MTIRRASIDALKRQLLGMKAAELQATHDYQRLVELWEALTKEDWTYYVSRNYPGFSPEDQKAASPAREPSRTPHKQSSQA